jgi:hypothetical protein
MIFETGARSSLVISRPRSPYYDLHEMGGAERESRKNFRNFQARMSSRDGRTTNSAPVPDTNSMLTFTA